MNDNDKDYTGFTHTFTWDANPQHMHPYTYSLTDYLCNSIDTVGSSQIEVEWSESYLNFIDYLVDEMTSYPDAEKIIANMRDSII